jgi:hypothetical protein
LRTAKIISIFNIVFQITALAAPCLADAETRTQRLIVSLLTPILPVSFGVMQEIGITLDSPGSGVSDEFEATVTAESGYGILLLPDAPAPSGSLTCRTGEVTALQYRWSGALPIDAPVTETVTVQIPTLGLAASAEFSIGVDMRIIDLTISGSAESRRASPVSVLMRDSFHPDAPIDSILSSLGITPELRLLLIPDSPIADLDPTVALIVSRFLGERTPAIHKTAYPSDEFKQGFLSGGSEAGTFTWNSADGQSPEVSPPAPGQYLLTAILKPNTGGVAVKEFTTRFEAGGAMPPAWGLPGLFGAAAEILDALGSPSTEAAAAAARESLETHDEGQAAEFLGRAFKNTPGASDLSALGKFADAVVSVLDIESASPFMQSFLSGYGSAGVLVMTKSGVKSWNTDLATNFSSSSGSYVVIPFNAEKNFILNVEGSDEGATSLWKIVPQGVNRKEYAKGDWEKEITVYTAQLAPQ